MPRIYTVTVSGLKQVSRECSNCGHQWYARRNVNASGSDPRGYAYARQEAESNLQKQIEKTHILSLEDALCERCDHFSIITMQEYFKKGYASGMLQICRISIYGWSFGFFALCALSWLIVYVNLDKNILETILGTIRTPIIVVYILLLINVIILIIKFIRYIQISNMVSNISDERLLSICADIYKVDKKLSLSNIGKKLKSL